MTKSQEVSFIQEMLNDGTATFTAEVIEKAHKAGELIDTFDEALGKTKLPKMIPIKEAKRLVEEGLTTRTVLELQEAKLVKAGTVGGGGRRSAGPAYGIENGDEEPKRVYPRLYFEGGGKQGDAQKAFKADFEKLCAKHCTLDAETAEEAPSE